MPFERGYSCSLDDVRLRRSVASTDQHETWAATSFEAQVGLAGWLRPAPWLLALLLVAVLSVLWFFAVSRFLRAGAWGENSPHGR
jgi:hypothetical protein